MKDGSVKSFVKSVLLTEWQKNLAAKKWIREKLCTAISNDDFFALLFFCLPFDCPPEAARPRWVHSVLDPSLLESFRNGLEPGYLWTNAAPDFLAHQAVPD